MAGIMLCATRFIFSPFLTKTHFTLHRYAPSHDAPSRDAASHVRATLYHPNDAGNDLYTNYDCSSSEYDPNPASGC